MPPPAPLTITRRARERATRDNVLRCYRHSAPPPTPYGRNDDDRFNRFPFRSFGANIQSVVYWFITDHIQHPTVRRARDKEKSVCFVFFLLLFLLFRRLRADRGRRSYWQCSNFLRAPPPPPNGPNVTLFSKTIVITNNDNNTVDVFFNITLFFSFALV